MKIIKFRGKRADNDEWVYGYFFVSSGSSFILNNEGQFQIRSDTERQYIGREDKNGKEIYEGDILNPTQDFYGGTPDFLGMVEWSDGDTEFQVITDHPQNASYWIEWTKPEVIGNTIDNPELLEKKK